MTRYMTGVFNRVLSNWTFDFFDSAIFLDELEEALMTSGDERTITDFYLSICNTEKEVLQDVPFVIIHKEQFPEN